MTQRHNLVTSKKLKAIKKYNLAKDMKRPFYRRKMSKHYLQLQ